MKTTIYYYSATGNSLVIARRIARELGDAEIRPLAKFRAGNAPADSERVGIVFPIIAWGPTRTVKEFIENFNPEKVRYFFAIASCGGTAAGTLPRIRSSLRKRGGDLHAGFIVRSPGYLKSSGGSQSKMISFVQKLSGKQFGADEERLPGIIDAIKNNRTVKPERNAFLGSLVGNFFHDQAAAQFPKIDGNYKVAPSCVGCGTCANICPRENIHLEDGKPTWRHDCDFCGACGNWCPQGSISFGGDLSPAQEHNPEVALKDFILR